LDARQILCPVDFSDASAHAIAQAAALARWYGARITALHVDTAGRPASTHSRMQKSQHARWTRPSNSACRIAWPCSAWPQQPRASRSCPVLTVPPPAHAASTLPFKQLLCAVDFSDPSLEAVRFAGSLARQAGARLVLMHVLEWPWHEPPAPRLVDLPPAQAAALAEYRRYVEATATARLESVASSDVPPGTPTVAHVGHGKPYEQLLEAARKEGADLIVLGVHGRNALDLSVFGSTTNQLVRGATCPVLTVRR